jgi:hypothetical protein
MITVLTGPGADCGVVDREVTEVQQPVTAVPRDKLLQTHRRAAHAKPDKVSRPHPAWVCNRLEVLPVVNGIL